MADGEEPLVQESAAPVVSDADPSRRCVRLAHTLLPGAEPGARLPAPPRDPGPVPSRGGALAEFRGWPGCPKLWMRWVDKLRPRHEPLWRDLGILDAILAATYRVRRDEGALLQLAAFWSAATSTFVFPWGEATVTLQDVAALAGLPLVGGPVRAPVPGDLEKEVGALEAVRVVLNQSKNRKPSYGVWVKYFLERAPPDTGASAAGGRGDLVEHGAFLSLWLSRFVLPSPPLDVVHPDTSPVAVRLAHGQSVALAPASLASIYSDLSAIKRRLGLRNNREPPPFGVSAPMRILQLWVWERFPELRSKMEKSPAPDVNGVPRVARWHDARSVLDTRYVFGVLMSPKEFEWRPYGSSSVALQPETCGCWVRGQDITRSKALLSFARCLRACELVGMKCIEKYRPHRVARQLGFDQDVPGVVVRANSRWEEAWDTYNIEAKNLAFIVPDHKPGMTVKYAQWWEPYSLACATAVANSVKTKGLCVLVSPVKRKMEGLPAANSGKKMCVDTSIRIHRTAPDAAEELEDEIPLVERLNSIIKMTRKQHTTEFAVKGAEQELIAESPYSFRSISASVGAKKATLHKDFEQAVADEFTGSLSMVDGLSCGSLTKMTLNKCLQQTEEEDLVISNEEKNSIPEYGDLFPNVIQSAASSESDEAVVGAASEVDMFPSSEDILKIRDSEVESSLSDRTLRQEPDVLAHTAPIQTYVGHSEGSTKEMQKCIVAGDKVHKDKDVLVSNEELESVIENLAEAYRKKSGNSERPASRRQVDGITKQVGREVCTKTIYYLSRFDRTKDAWDKDANTMGGNQDVKMPRRAVGTMEMIKMASALRKAEIIAGLKKNIDRLKEEILALEAADNLKK
ncbi:uncharacterized protein LOC120693463 [Panicum virgatum]|uniref:uncharacterized protein LOC120693463 n=1 Tax=Panicum virgatum TaxID=38727 RepID=UPI0019D5B6FA|nr:uncharacterized protein LOC120693463 [Panicum virgatum]